MVKRNRPLGRLGELWLLHDTGIFSGSLQNCTELIASLPESKEAALSRALQMVVHESNNPNVKAAGEFIGIRDGRVPDPIWTDGEHAATPLNMRTARGGQALRRKVVSIKRAEGHIDECLRDLLRELEQHILGLPGLPNTTRAAGSDLKHQEVGEALQAAVPEEDRDRLRNPLGRGRLMSPEEHPVIRTEKAVHAALEDARGLCRNLDRQFLTPHLVFAILELPSSKAAKCFEATNVGLTREWSARHESFRAPDPDSHFRDFDWDECFEFRFAKQFVLQNYPANNDPYIGELHLLLGFLENKQSNTRNGLVKMLGTSQFEQMREIAMRMLDEADTPGTDVANER